MYMILSKYPLYWSDMKETQIFSIDFRKILRHQTLWNLLSGSCYIRTDTRTDITKRMAAYRNIANAHTTYRVSPQTSSLKFKIIHNTVRQATLKTATALQQTAVKTYSYHKCYSSKGNSQFQQRYLLQLISSQSYPSSLNTSFQGLI